MISLDPKRVKIFKIVVSSLIGLIILGAFIQSAEEEKKVSITADAKFGPTLDAIIVTNKDTFEWTSVEIGVCPAARGPFYGKKISRLGPGQTVTVALSDMTDDGKRFNSFEYKIALVYVECKTPQGKGWWSARGTKE